MANKDCYHPAYRDSLAKCLLVFGVSRSKFAGDAGVSRETIREYLDEGSHPYERTMHKILKTMQQNGWLFKDHFSVPSTEQTIDIEGKRFTVTELKNLISNAK